MQKNRFDPWVGKIPWRREWLPTPAFWLENSVDCIVHGVAKSDTTERLSLIHFFKKHPSLGNAQLLINCPENGFIV